MSKLVEIKANLLKEFYQKHGHDWVYTCGRGSEEGKSHYLHRHAFIQDLALDIAANLKLNNFTNFFDDATAYANTTRCHEMLVNYFSSGPFATSQVVDGYDRAYTIFIMQETIDLAADFLKIGNEPIPKKFLKIVKKAYYDSTHYAKSQLPSDNILKTFIPYDFENDDHENTNTDSAQNPLSAMKKNLLEEYTAGLHEKWVYATSRASEINKSHSLHRDAFVQDLALEMAAYLKANDSKNLYNDSITFVQTEACQDMLANYFSSGPFATSQVVDGYDRNYTLFVLQDTAHLAADFLKLSDLESIPDYNDFFKYTKEAYCQSTHYRDSQLAYDNPYKTVVPHDFGERTVTSIFSRSSEASVTVPSNVVAPSIAP